MRSGWGGRLGSVRVLFVDSGLGSLSASSVLRGQRPDLDIVLAMDPEFMPWGSQTPQTVVDRARYSVEVVLARWDDVAAVVLACNTASVHALPALRSELEPEVPVIGTVPAIKPAAARCRRVAVWATPVTASSEYQRALVAEHAGGATVTVMACDGLAAAVESGDQQRVEAAVQHWASETPPDVDGLVLGSTHYRLVEDRVALALPAVSLFDSAEAVVGQLLQRAAAALANPNPGDGGRVDVLASGAPGEFPERALRYPRGRLLAQATRRAERRPAVDPG